MEVQAASADSLPLLFVDREELFVAKRSRRLKKATLLKGRDMRSVPHMLLVDFMTISLVPEAEDSNPELDFSDTEPVDWVTDSQSARGWTTHRPDKSSDDISGAGRNISSEDRLGSVDSEGTSSQSLGSAVLHSSLLDGPASQYKPTSPGHGDGVEGEVKDNENSSNGQWTSADDRLDAKQVGGQNVEVDTWIGAHRTQDSPSVQHFQSPEGEYPDATSPSCSLSANVVHSSSARDPSHTDSVLECNLHKQASVDRGESFEVAEENIIRQSPFLQFSRSGNTFTGFPLLMTESAEHVSEKDVSVTTTSQVRLVEDKSGVMNCESVNEDSVLFPAQSESNVSSSQAEDTFSTNTFESTSVADVSGYPIDSGMECSSTDDEQISKSDDVLSHSSDVVEVVKTDISSSSVPTKKFSAPSVERGESFEATISKPLLRQDHFGFGLHFGMFQPTWSSLDPENERSTLIQKDVIEETKDETTESTMNCDELHSTSTTLVTASSSEKVSFKTQSGDSENVTRLNGDSDDGSVDDTKLRNQYSAEREDSSALCDSVQKSYVYDQVQGLDKAHEKSDSFEYVHGDALVQHASFTPRSLHIPEAQQAPEDVSEVSYSSYVTAATAPVSTEQVREVSHIIMDNPVITNPETRVTDNKDRVIEEIQLSGSFIETEDTNLDPQIVTEQADTVKSSSKQLPSMRSIERGESFEAASPSKLQRSIHSGFSQGSSEFLVSVHSSLKEVDETPSESYDLRDTSMQVDDQLHDIGNTLIQCEDQSDVSEKSTSVSNAAAMDSEQIGEQSTQEAMVLIQTSADATSGITSESRSSQDIPDTDNPIKRARSIERGESFEIYKPKSLPLQKHDFLINGGNFNTSSHIILEGEREDGDQSTKQEAGIEDEMKNSSSWMEKVASPAREAYSSLEKRLQRKKRTSKNGVNTESANSLDIEEEDEGSSSEEDDTPSEEQFRSENSLEVRVSTTDVPEDFPSEESSRRYVSFASLSLSDRESLSTEKHPEYSSQVQILEKSNPVSVRKYSEETVEPEYTKTDNKLYMDNKMPDVQRADPFPADSVINENVDNSEKTPVFLESRLADNTAEPSLNGALQNRNQQSSSEHRRAMFKTYGQKCQMGESVSDQSSVFSSVTSMNSNVLSSSIVSDSAEGQEEREFSPESPLYMPNQTDTLPVMPDKASEKHETVNSASTFCPPERYQTEYERNFSTSSSTFSQSVSLDSFQNAFTAQVMDPSVQSLHDELASATRGTSFKSHKDDEQSSIERIPANKQAAAQEKGSDSDEEPPEVEIESHINVELEPEQPFVQDVANTGNWDPSLTFEDRGPDMNATRWNRAYLTRYSSFGDSGQPTTAESQSHLTRHQSLGESTKYDSAKNRAHLSRYHSAGDSTMSATTKNYQSSFTPTDLAMGVSYTAGQQSEPNTSSDLQSALNKTDSLSYPEVSQQPASEIKPGPSDLNSVEEASRKKQESYQYGRSNNQSFDTRIEETNSGIRQHEEEYPVDSESYKEKESRVYQDMPAYQQDAAADCLVLEKPMPAQENAFLDSRTDTPYGTLTSTEFHLKEFSSADGRRAPDDEESETDHSTDDKIVAETSESLSAPLKSADEERLLDTDQLSISKHAPDVEPMTLTVHTSLKEESRALFDQPPSQQMPQQKLSPEEVEDFQIMQTLSELTQLWDDENAEGGSAVSSTSSFIPSDGERPKKMAYTSKVVSFSRQNSVNPSDVFEDEQDPDILEKELEETVVEETVFDSSEHTDLPSSTETPLNLSAQADVESEIWKQDLGQEMNSVPVPPGEKTDKGNNDTDRKDSWPSVLARDSLLQKADEDSGQVYVRDSDEVTASEESLLVKTSSTQKLHAVEIPTKSSDDRLALDKTPTQDIIEERHTSLFEDPLKTGQSSSSYDNSAVMHVDRGESFELMTRKKLPLGLSGGFLTGVPLPTTESENDETQSSSWIKRIVTAAKGAYDSLGQKLKRKPKHEKSKSGDGEEEGTSDEDDSDTEHDTDNTHHGDSTNTVTDQVTMITAGETMPSLDQQRLECPDAQPGDLVIPEFAEKSVTLESSSIMIPSSDFQSHEQVPATSSLHSTVPSDHVQTEEVQWEITGLQIQAEEPDADDLKPLLFEQTFDRTSVFKDNISGDSDGREDDRLSAAKPRTSEKEEENQEIEADDASHQSIPTQMLFNRLVENANGTDQKKMSTDFDANNVCYEEENNPCDEDVFTASTDALKDSSSEQLSASSSTSASRSQSVSSDIAANPNDTVDGYEKLQSEPEEYFNSDSMIFTNSSVVEEGYEGFVPSTDEKSRLRSRHRSGATERHDSYSTSEADDDNKDRVHKSCTQIKHKPDKILHLVADSWMDYEADDETCSDRPASVSDSLPVLSNQQSQESDPMTGVEESETHEQFSENPELKHTDMHQFVNKDIHTDTSFNLDSTAIISSSGRTGGAAEMEQSAGFEQNHGNESEIHSLAKDIVSDVITGARKQVLEDPDVEDKQRSPTILENNEPLEAMSQERMQLAESSVLLESSGTPHENFLSTSNEKVQAALNSKPTAEIQKGLTQVTLPGYYQSLSAESVPSATDMSPLEDYPLTFGSTDIEDLSIFTETDLKQWSDSQTTQSPTEEAVSNELINPSGGDEELKHSKAEQSNNEVERGLEKDYSEQASSQKLEKLHAQPIFSSEDSAQDDLEKERAHINKDISRLSREFSDNSVNLGPYLSRSIDSLTLVNFEAQAAMQMEFAAQNAFSSSVDDLDSPVFPSRGVLPKYQTSSEDASWTNDVSRDGVLSISSFDVVPSSPVSVDGIPAQEPFSESMPNASSIDISQSSQPSAGSTSKPSELPDGRFSSGSVEETQDKKDIHSVESPQTADIVSSQKEETDDTIGPGVSRYHLQRSDALTLELDVSPDLPLSVQHKTESPSQEISGDHEFIFDSGHSVSLAEQSLSVKTVCPDTAAPQFEEPQAWQQEDIVPDSSDTDSMMKDSLLLAPVSSENTEYSDIPKHDIVSEQTSDSKQPPDDGRSSPSWMEKVIVTAKNAYGSLEKRLRRKKKKKATADEGGDQGIVDDFSDEDECSDYDEDSAEYKQDENDDVEQMKQISDGRSAYIAAEGTEPFESSEDFEQNFNAAGPDKHPLVFELNQETPLGTSQHFDYGDARSAEETADDIIQMTSATSVSRQADPDLETTLESSSNTAKQSTGTIPSLAMTTNLQWPDKDKDTLIEDKGQSSESSQRFLEASDGLSCAVSQSPDSTWDSGHGVSLEEQSLSVKAVCPDTATAQSEEPQVWQQEDIVPDTSDTNAMMKDSLLLAPLTSESSEQADTSHGQTSSEPEQRTDADGRSSPSWMEKVVTTAKDTYSSLGKRLRRKKKKPASDEDGDHSSKDEVSEEEEYTESDEDSTGNRRDEDEDVGQMKQTHTRRLLIDTPEATGLYESEFSQDFAHTFHATEAEKPSLAFGSEQQTPIHSLEHFVDNDTLSTEHKADNTIQKSSAIIVSSQANPDLETSLELSPNLAEVSEETAPSLAITTNIQWPDKDKDTPTEDKGQSSEGSLRFLEASGGLSCTVSHSPDSTWDSGHGVSLEEQSLTVKAVCPDTATLQSEEPQVWQQEGIHPMMKNSHWLEPLTSESSEQADTSHGQTPSEPEQCTDADGRSSPSWMEKVVTTAKDAYSSLEKRLKRKKKKKPANDEEGDQGIEDDFSEEDYTESDDESAEGRRDEDVDQLKRRSDEGSFPSILDDRGLDEPESPADFKQNFYDNGTEKLPLTFGLEQEMPNYGFGHSSDNSARSTDDAADDSIQMSSATLVSLQADPDLEPALELTPTTVEQSMETAPSLAMTTNLQWPDKDRDTQSEDKSQSSESSQRFLETSDRLSCTVSQSPESPWDSGHGVSLEEQSLSMKAVCPDTATAHSEEPQVWQQEHFVPDTSDTDPMLKDLLLLIPLTSENVKHIDTSTQDVVPKQTPSEPEQPVDADGRSSPSWMEKVVTTAKDTYGSLEKRLRRKKKKKPASDEDGDLGIEDDFSEEEYTESDEDSAEDRPDKDEDVDKIKWRHDEGPYTSALDDRELYELDSSADLKQTVQDTEREKHSRAYNLEQEMPIQDLGQFDANVKHSTEDTADDIVQMPSATLISHQADPDLQTTRELLPNVAEVSEETAPSLTMTTNLQWTDEDRDTPTADDVVKMSSATLVSRHADSDLESALELTPNIEQSLETTPSLAMKTNLQWPDKDRDTQSEDKGQTSESSQWFLEASGGVSCTVSQSPEPPWDSGHGVSLEEQSLSVKAVCPGTATAQSEESQVWQQEDFVPDTSDTDPMMKDSLLLAPLTSESSEHIDTSTQDMVPKQTPSEPEYPTDADGRSSPSWMEKVVTTAKDAYSSLGKRLRRKKKKKPASDEDGDQGIEDNVTDEEEYTESDEDSADDRRDEDEDTDQMKQKHDEKPVASASEATGLYLPESSEDLVSTFHAADTEKLPHSAGLEQEPPIHSLQHFNLSDTHSADATTDDLVQMSSATMVFRRADPDLETTLELSSNLAEQPVETVQSLTMTTNLQWPDKDRDTPTEDKGQSSESSHRFMEVSDGLSCTVSQTPDSTWDSGRGVSLEDQSLSVKAVSPDTATPQFEEPQVWQQQDTHPMIKDSQLLASLTSESSEQADTSHQNMGHGQTPSEPEQPTDADGRSSPSWMEKVVTTAKDTYSSLGKRLRRKKKKPASDEDGDQGIEDNSEEEEYTESDEERAEHRRDEDEDIDKLQWRHHGGLFTSVQDDRELHEPESSTNFKQTVHDTDTEQCTLAFDLAQQMPTHDLGHFDANVTRLKADTAEGIVQMSSTTLVSRQVDPDLETTVELSPNLAEVSEETAPSMAMTTNLQWTESDTPTEDLAQSSESSQRFLGAFNELYCPGIQSTVSPWDRGHGVSLEEQSLSVKAVCPDTATQQSEKPQVWQQEDIVPDTSDTDAMMKDSLLLAPLTSESSEQADTATQDMGHGQISSEPEQPTDADGRSSPSWMEKVVTTAKDTYSTLEKRLRRKKKKKPASGEDGEYGTEDGVRDGEDYTESDEDSGDDRLGEDEDVDQLKRRQDEESFTSTVDDRGLYEPESSADFKQTLLDSDTEKLPLTFGLEQETTIHSLAYFDDDGTCSRDDTADGIVQMSSTTMISRQADPDLEPTLELTPTTVGQSMETAPSLAMTTNLQWPDKDRDTQPEDKGQSSESSQRFLETSDGLSCTVSQSPESPWDSGHGVSLEEQSLSVKAVCPNTAAAQSEELQVWQQKHFVPDTSDTDPMMKDSLLLAPLPSEYVEHIDTSTQDMVPEQTPSEPEQPTDADGRSSPSWMEKVVTTAKDTYSSLEKRLRRKKKKKPASDEDGDQDIEDNVSDEEEYSDSDENSAEEGAGTLESVDKMRQVHDGDTSTGALHSEEFEQTLLDSKHKDDYILPEERSTLSLTLKEEQPVGSAQHVDDIDRHLTDEVRDEVIQMTSATMVSRMSELEREQTVNLSPTSAEQSIEASPTLALTTNLQGAEKDKDTQSEDRGQSSESSQRFLEASDGPSCAVFQSPDSTWDSGRGVSLEEQSLSVKAARPDICTPQSEAEDASHRVNEGGTAEDDSSFTEEEEASLSASDEELSSDAKDNAEVENRYRDSYFSALAEKKEDSNVASTEHAQKVLHVHELPSSTAEYHDTYVSALAERGRTVSISHEISDQSSATEHQQDQETAVSSADLQLDKKIVEQAKDTEEDRQEDNKGDDKHDTPQTNNRGSGQDTKQDLKDGLEPDTVQITERNTSSFTTQDYDAAIVAAVLEADRRLSKSFSEDPSILSDAYSDGQNTDDDREQSVFDQESSETCDQLFSPPLLPSETPRSDQKQTEQTFSQKGEDRGNREEFLINTAESMPVHKVTTDMKQMADLQAETDTQVEFDRDSSKLGTQHTDSGDTAAVMRAGQGADTRLPSDYQMKAGEPHGEQLARGNSKQATRRASWLKRAVSKAKDAFTSVEERFKRKRKQKVDGNLETRTGQGSDDIVQDSTDDSDEEDVDTEALTTTKEDNTAVRSQTQRELYNDTILEKAVSQTQRFSSEDDQLVLSGTTEPSLRARGYDSTGNWSRGNNDTASVSLPSQQGSALFHPQSSSEHEQRLLQEGRRSTVERTEQYSGTQQGESVEDVMQHGLVSSVASASSEGFQRYLPQHSEATTGTANNQDWNQNTTVDGFCRKETRLPVSRQLALSTNNSETFDERSTLRLQDQTTGHLSTEANQHFFTGTSNLNVESSRQDMSAPLGDGQILCTGEQKSFISPPLGQERAEDVIEDNKASAAETIRTSSSETLMRNVMTTVSHTSVLSPTSTRPTESGEGSVREPRQDNLISDHASSTSEYRQSVLPGTSELAFQRDDTTDAMTRSDVGLSFVSTHALSMPSEHQSHGSTEDNQRTVTGDKEILLQVRAAEAEYEGTGGARTFLGRHVARPMPQHSADGTCDTALEADDKPLIGNEAAEDENEAAQADQENIDPSNMPLSGLFKTTKGKKSKSKKGKDKDATDTPVTDDVTSKEEAKAEEQAQATMSDTKTDTMTAGDQNSAAVLYTTEIGDSAQTPGEGPQLRPPEGGVVEMQPAKADGSLPPETAGREKQSLLHDHNPEGMVCCTIL